METIDLSIVTIAYQNFEELKETLETIDSQTIKPQENNLILSGFNDKEKEAILKKYSRSYRNFYWDLDSSLFNAMNVGIDKSNSYFILFLNAGDTFYSNYCLEVAKTNLHEDICYSFKTLQVFENISILRENIPQKGLLGLGRETNLPPHQGFIAPNKKEIYFNENLRVSADNEWMGRNMSKYGIFFSDKIIANFKLGGQSTYPTLKIIYIKLKYEKFLRFVIECLKYSYSLFVSKKLYFVTMAKLRKYRIIEK